MPQSLNETVAAQAEINAEAAVARYQERLCRPMTDIERAAVAEAERITTRREARHALWLAQRGRF